MLAVELEIGLGDGVGIEHPVRAALGGALVVCRPMPPSMTKCPTWMFLGASSRAMLCARPRSPNLPMAKGAERA